MTNKDEAYRHFFERRQRAFLKTLVTEELVAEHKAHPLGQHTEALERLLIYFRMQPPAGKHAVVTLDPFKAYCIVALSGHRGVPPRAVDDKVYPSEEEAFHALFLLRVQKLLES